MKKSFARLWISCAGVLVMLLTGTLILVFYIATFFRKLFIKDFVPNAKKDTLEDIAAQDMLGTANAHLNALKASLEKPKAP